MAVSVFLENPTTKKVAHIKVGWSWTVFFFGWTGIPLFKRKMTAWGVAMIIFSIAGSAYSIATDKPQPAILLIVNIMLAATANKTFAKILLSDGWQFADPASDGAMAAKAKWGLS